MNYIKLKGEIVLLDNILHAEMKENTIELLYGIFVPDQGYKFYGHVLDYSEVKNDINEEKTKIEQDYDKISHFLNVQEVIPKTPDYKKQSQQYLNKMLDLEAMILDIENIVKGSGINKIKRIKEVLENDV